jgi:pantoate--beta-alanine ligase
MKIIENPKEFQKWALAQRAAGRRVGLVPTMGNLHEGHLSLVRIAKKHADVVALSDFVNPTQFGPNEDYAAYPRTFEEDCAKCEAEEVDMVFHPAPEAMYAADASVSLIERGLSKVLCGASRPGHFDGVCTVVAKLFLLAQPHVAVFGQKDAQQLCVIRRMVRDMFFPIEIVAAPISREADGLARSSRNRYLSSEERAQAPVLRRSLAAMEDAFAAGERDAEALRAVVRGVLAESPLAKPEYVELVDAETLQSLDGLVTRPALAALAVRFGTTRLIDNTVLGGTGNTL